jgi:hypothetical protein
VPVMLYDAKLSNRQMNYWKKEFMLLVLFPSAKG